MNLWALPSTVFAFLPSRAFGKWPDRETERALLSEQVKKELISDDEMQQIKSNYLINRSANLDMQFVSSKHVTTVANGIEYDLSQLEPATLSTNFEAMVDGNILMPIAPIYEGTVNGAHIIMRKDDSERPEFISINNGVNSTSLVSVAASSSESIFLTITERDWDEEALERFVSDDILEIEPTAASSGVSNTASGLRLPRERTRLRWNRDPQGSCSNFQTIEVAIAYDHTFCKIYGSASAAVTRIRTIVSLASKICEPLCIKIVLSAIQGFCEESTDLYHSETNERASGCKVDDGLLQGFKRLWESRDQFKRLNRDVAHIFMGQSFTSGGLGCAWIGQLCNTWSYGVNSMSFSSSDDHQALLFAHELGHNMGGSHSALGYVMSPFVAKDNSGWRDDVREAIANNVQQRSCVSQENGGADGGGGGANSTSPPSTLEGTFYEIRALTNEGKGCWTHPDGDGEQMEVRRCTAQQNQKFSIDFRAGTVRSSRGDTCVTTSTDVGANKENVILTNCDANDSKQNWIGSGDGALRPRVNRNNCISRKRSDLLLVPCSGDILKDNRKWKIIRLGP